MQPTVALFSTNFLDYSQTFVFEELRAHRRYRAEVFCARRHNADRFPYDAVHEGGVTYLATRRSPRFDRLLESGAYGVLHAHFGTGGVYAVPFARRHRLPLVVTFHGYEVPLLGSVKRLVPRNLPYALTAPALLEHMTLGLCASTELLEMLHDLGVPRERLRLHRIGIDLTRFHRGARDPERPRLAMVGRFVEKKGFEYGLRAFARVARGSGAELVVIGGGERERRLRSIVQHEGIAEQVRFAGVLTNDQVAAELARSDVLLAPSVVTVDGDRESGLVAVKEASASECVPVTTWHGGIPDIVDDGETGYLVHERDVEALADRLARLLADPDLRARMGVAARRKMEREYDNVERVAALEDRYDEARGLR
ncbi:MAG: glycosyltransferase [Myxococcota bacterium]